MRQFSRLSHLSRPPCRLPRTHCPRFFSAAAQPRPSAPAPTTPLTPPSSLLSRALSDLSTLPELPQALQAHDPQLSHTLLHRLLHIFPTTSSATAPHAAVLHSLLARLHHRLGSLSAERGHRVHVTSLLSDSIPSCPDPSDAALHAAHTASAHLALALCCLRGSNAEARLAASGAASAAQSNAAAPPLRTAASLLRGLSTGGKSMRALLSALVAVDGGEGDVVDVPGFARLFLAVHGGEGVDRTDHAKALVVRWEGRGGFDFVEALCAAAEVVEEGDRELAEDLLARGVRVAGEVGNELDKSEPLLRMAGVYERSGRVVEAEGLYRSVEERFVKVWEKRMFTVSSADVYARAMDAFGDFLERVEFNGRTREKEGQTKRERAREVREIYPEVLCEGQPCVPFWVVDSMLPYFELPEPPI